MAIFINLTIKISLNNFIMSFDILPGQCGTRSTTGNNPISIWTHFYKINKKTHYFH